MEPTASPRPPGRRGAPGRPETSPTPGESRRPEAGRTPRETRRPETSRGPDGRDREPNDATRVELDPPPGLERDAALRLLRDGEIEVRGRLLNASNATLFCSVRLPCPPPEPALSADCIYKPTRGERPLFDFPDGTLAKREVAAYELSAASGLDVAPPTVLRDGPFGPGMVQLWIDVDEQVDLVDLIRSGDLRLRRIAFFDAIVNNADRKGGHLLPARSGHLYGVDHGICFAVEPKLRTILWQWRGQRLTSTERRVLADLRDALDGELGHRLRGLLAPVEVRATARRVERLLSEGRFPSPDPDRPAIPWPPF